jgi:hypothetical protein
MERVMTDKNVENLPQVLEQETALSVFASIPQFENAMRMAKLLASSKMIKKDFQNNIPDCVIALEYASRMGVSPIALMQSMHVVHGNPGLSGQFIIGLINTSGKFSPLRFKFSGQGGTRSCFAYCTELATGEVIEGSTVSIQMAKDEGWMKNPKWTSMPDQMLMYRSATFFGRVYAPELIQGMRTIEEIIDEAITLAEDNDPAAKIQKLSQVDKGPAEKNPSGMGLTQEQKDKWKQEPEIKKPAKKKEKKVETPPPPEQEDPITEAVNNYLHEEEESAPVKKESTPTEKESQPETPEKVNLADSYLNRIFAAIDELQGVDCVQELDKIDLELQAEEKLDNDTWNQICNTLEQKRQQASAGI